ncbi:MAG: ABC transporter permease [Gammaproteobacteria bacterium]|jgi:ABC-2 type transport system permease protein
MMIFTIAGRELRNMFLSPLAWTVLAIVELVMTYLFSAQIEYFGLVQQRLVGMEGAPGVTDLVAAPVFSSAAIVLLMVVPLLSMRLVSDERRNGTLSLLLTAPVSMTEIVLGKFLGLFSFLLIMLAVIAAMPLSLEMGTTLDLGKLFAGVLGLGLLLGSFAAIGLFMSTLTRHPVVAAMSTFGLLLLLWILDWAAKGSEMASGLFSYLSLQRHMETMLKGNFNSTDFVYYLILMIAFLGFSIRRLDAERLQH